MRHEIDRAHRDLSGISVGSSGIVIDANPFAFYWVFWVIWVVFGDFRGEDED